MELIKVVQCHFRIILILFCSLYIWGCHAEERKKLPFRFVSSEFNWSGSYCVVQDDSSRKGIYSMYQDSLIIPCEYEDISILGKGYFDATFKHKAINMHCLIDSLNHKYVEVCDYIKWDAPTIIKAMNLEDDGYYINIQTKEQRRHTAADTKNRLTIISGYQGRSISAYSSMDSFTGNTVLWKSGILNTNFEPIIKEITNDIYVLDDNVIAYRNTKKWGLRNIRANTKTPTLFNDIKYCSDRLYSAQFYNGKWGAIDTVGKTIISPQYDKPFEFDCGYAIVMKNGKQGVIRINGTRSINFTSHKLVYLGFGLFEKIDNGNICICNGEGLVIINGLKGEDVYPNELYAGFIPYNYLRNGEKRSCYYTSEGKRIIDGKYKNVYCFDELGYALVLDYNDMYGMIDKNMNEVVPCNYEQICCYSPLSHTVMYIKNHILYQEHMDE